MTGRAFHVKRPPGFIATTNPHHPNHHTQDVMSQ